MIKKLLALACLTLLAGCVSTQTTYVKVNALASPTLGYGRSYVILNADRVEGNGSLQFGEFAAMVERALAAKGFVRLPMSLKDSEDMTVVLGYKVSEPKTVKILEKKPIYGDVGIASIEKKDDKTIIHRERGIIGYDHTMRYETTYDYTVTLDATDAMTLRTGGGTVSLWKTTLATTTDSSDMRAVFPRMIAAGALYFGYDSGKEIEIKISDDDPRLASVLPLPLVPVAPVVK